MAPSAPPATAPMPVPLAVFLFSVAQLDASSEIAVKDNKATIYKPGTILIICIGGGIGRLGITSKICSSNQQITGILFEKSILPEFAYYFFLSRYKIFEENSSKSTLPIINQKGLGNVQSTDSGLFGTI